MSVNEWEVENFTLKQLILETNNDIFSFTIVETASNYLTLIWQYNYI